jgi:hypothetical protein
MPFSVAEVNLGKDGMFGNGIGVLSVSEFGFGSNGHG